MASRRMVSIKIIDSAKFIKMPSSTQALYFHLIARADDDGIVEAFNVMRMTASAEDDLKILVGKQFVKVLNEDLVSYILDWHEHNKIRADRKVDSIYKDLLLDVIPDVKLLETKPRADRIGTSQGQPTVGVGKVSIGKDRKGKDSIEKKNNSRFAPPTYEEVNNYCIERNNFVDAKRFIDFYEMKGWMVGKNKMKDWKAAVRTWEKNDVIKTGKVADF